MALSNPPQVSVIIPVFNGEATIARALDSVAAQTFKDFEIIVVDDASTDRSVDVVSRYGSDRVKLITHPQNRGAAAARNTGIAAARGHWLAFLDADDSWKPHKLSRQLSILGQERGRIPACVSGYDLHKDGRTLAIHLSIRPHAIPPGNSVRLHHRAREHIGGRAARLRRRRRLRRSLSPSGRLGLAPALFGALRTGICRRAARGCVRRGNGGASRPPGPDNPELDGIQRMGTKHLSRLGSWAERMQLRSSLLFEQGAALYRGHRPLAAALYVAAALCIYPMRNVASFRTLRYSAGARLFK